MLVYRIQEKNFKSWFCNYRIRRRVSHHPRCTRSDDVGVGASHAQPLTCFVAACRPVFTRSSAFHFSEKRSLLVDSHSIWRCDSFVEGTALLPLAPRSLADTSGVGGEREGKGFVPVLSDDMSEQGWKRCRNWLWCRAAECQTFSVQPPDLTGCGWVRKGVGRAGVLEFLPAGAWATGPWLQLSVFSCLPKLVARLCFPDIGEGLTYLAKHEPVERLWQVVNLTMFARVSSVRW